MTVLPLSQLSRGELEFLRKAIVQGTVSLPLSAVGLAAKGRSGLVGRLGPLLGASKEVALALIDLALASERTAESTPRSASLLVWTGPNVTTSSARATTPVLLELLSLAQDRVLITGYTFDYGKVIFGPLHKAMLERNVKVTICLDVPPPPSPKSSLGAHLAMQVIKFQNDNWPFGPPVPKLLYWRDGGKYRSLHSKCVVVDANHLLIGSANFTSRGHTRNIEVGVRLEDPDLALTVLGQFQALVTNGHLRDLPAIEPRPAAPPVAAEDENDVVTPAPIVGPAALATELLVSEVAQPLFERLIASGVPVPDVGEDVVGEGGDVLGSPEFAWNAQRVAVLLAEQEGSRKKLEAAGWTCYSLALDQAAFEALSDLVRRDG